MQGVKAKAVLVLVLCFPVGIVAAVVRDLLHPELWDNNWLHDPRRYWPYLAMEVVLLIACSCQFWRLSRNIKRLEIRRSCRREAERCLDDGKLEEAKMWLRRSDKRR